MLFWGGLIVYGWLFILPLWGMAAYPDPGFSTGVDLRLAHRDGARPVPLRVEHLARRQPAEIHVQSAGRTASSWGSSSPKYIEAGDRKILCSGFWGAARHFNYLGEWCFGAVHRPRSSGTSACFWAWTYFIFVAVDLLLTANGAMTRTAPAKYGAEKWAEYQTRVKYPHRPGYLLSSGGAAGLERRLQPARAALCAAHVVNLIHPHDGADSRYRPDPRRYRRSWESETPDIDRTPIVIDRSSESETPDIDRTSPLSTGARSRRLRVSTGPLALSTGAESRRPGYRPGPRVIDRSWESETPDIDRTSTVIDRS